MKRRADGRRGESPLVIIGGGGHARVVLDLVRTQGREPLGYIDTASPHGPMTRLDGMRYLGELTEAIEDLRSIEHLEFLVAVGDNGGRARMYEEALRHGLYPAAAIHPTALVLGGAQIDPGAQICARAIIGVSARVRSNAIVNTAATIDHDGDIGEHASVAPGVLLAGGVTIGVGSHIGIGAVIRERINVGSWATVAAGAVVVHDVAEGSRVAGVPARPMPVPPPQRVDPSTSKA